MTSNEKFDQRKINSYLLGTLPAAEAELFDELSITDDEFAEYLRFAENQLVDAYVGGELTGADLETFDASYLASPLRREKVEFARTLAVFAANNKELKEVTDVEAEVTKPGLFEGMFAYQNLWRVTAFAALGMMVLIGWLVVDNLRLRTRYAEILVQQSEAERREAQLRVDLAEQSKAANKEADVARVEPDRQGTEPSNSDKSPSSNQNSAPPTRIASPKVAFFTLAAPLRSAGSLPTITVPPDVETISMRLEIEPNDLQRYRAVLKDKLGARIWRSPSLKAQGTGENMVLNVSFPAKLLHQNTYSLEVSGIGTNGTAEIIGDYFFRSVR